MHYGNRALLPVVIVGRFIYLNHSLISQYSCVVCANIIYEKFERKRLCDNDDISRQYKRIYAQGNALIRKFYMCTESVKCTLFKSCCTSLYTCQLWCCYRAESMRKLCVAYNNVFRFLCNEPQDCRVSYMFVSRGLPTCKMLIRKKCVVFFTCIARSGNAILQSIMNSDALYTSPVSPLAENALCI